MFLVIFNKNNYNVSFLLKKAYMIFVGLISNPSIGRLFMTLLNSPKKTNKQF